MAGSGGNIGAVGDRRAKFKVGGGSGAVAYNVAVQRCAVDGDVAGGNGGASWQLWAAAEIENHGAGGGDSSSSPHITVPSALRTGAANNVAASVAAVGGDGESFGGIECCGLCAARKKCHRLVD